MKVGEPEYPVAAVERGKAVIVGLNEKMVVADHDFTKFTLTPSVNLIIQIPETIEGSFYRGKVYAGLKDTVLCKSVVTGSQLLARQYKALWFRGLQY